MSSLKYDDVFAVFLGSITDYKLAKKDEEQAVDLMGKTLHKVVSHIYIYDLFESFECDDTSSMINYVIKYPTTESIDKDFVAMILGKAMVYYWYDPQVNNTLLTNQMISDTDKKFYSQAQHLSELKTIQEQAKLEVRKLIKDRQSRYNSYIK